MHKLTVQEIYHSALLGLGYIWSKGSRCLVDPTDAGVACLLYGASDTTATSEVVTVFMLDADPGVTYCKPVDPEKHARKCNTYSNGRSSGE
jgi:hypothetical protein